VALSNCLRNMLIAQINNCMWNNCCNHCGFSLVSLKWRLLARCPSGFNLQDAVYTQRYSNFTWYCELFQWFRPLLNQIENMRNMTKGGGSGTESLINHLKSKHRIHEGEDHKSRHRKRSDHKLRKRKWVLLRLQEEVKWPWKTVSCFNYNQV